ncbi:hypothetical protein BC937DRAFT_91519, partial [Endogone sp. FLAS-F59071]
TNTAEEVYQQALASHSFLAFQNFSNSSANKNSGKPIVLSLTPPCDTSFESDYFDNPTVPSPFPTPRQTPFQPYKEDPELSSTLPMMKYEHDESYGIIEFKNVYFNNNGNQTGTAYDKSVVPLDFDINFDDVDPTGNLIEPLHNQYQNILPSSTAPRKRKNPNTDARRESPIRRFVERTTLTANGHLGVPSAPRPLRASMTCNGMKDQCTGVNECTLVGSAKDNSHVKMRCRGTIQLMAAPTRSKPPRYWGCEDAADAAQIIATFGNLAHLRHIFGPGTIGNFNHMKSPFHLDCRRSCLMIPSRCLVE